MTPQNVCLIPFNTIISFLSGMMFELNLKRALFVVRSRALKKRSGGGREAPKLDTRCIAKIFIR